MSVEDLRRWMENARAAENHLFIGGCKVLSKIKDAARFGGEEATVTLTVSDCILLTEYINRKWMK